MQGRRRPNNDARPGRVSVKVIVVSVRYNMMAPTANGRKEDGQQVQRPHLTIKSVVTLLSKVYGLNTVQIEELDGYIDRNFYVKVTSDHLNLQVDEVCRDGYVFKVYNEIYSRNYQVGKYHILIPLFVLYMGKYLLLSVRCPTNIFYRFTF